MKVSMVFMKGENQFLMLLEAEYFQQKHGKEKD